MQRWEYMTWILGYADTHESDVGRAGGGFIKYLNGQLMPNWRDSPRLAQRLAEAGNAGWELISVAYPAAQSGTPSRDPLYIFKRPLP